MIKQLKDYIDIDDIIVNGAKCITSLFTSLGDSYNDHLKQLLNTDKDSLTLDYLGNRLDKILSPLYARLIDKFIADGDTTDQAIEHANAKLIKVIESKYLYNWNRLADAMFKDYNPINNYDMVENREVKEQTDRSVVTEGQNDVTDSTSTSTTETNTASVSESGRKSTTGNESVNVEENTEAEVNEDNKTTSSNSTTETKQEDGSTRTTTTGEITTNDVEQQKYAGFNTDSPKVVTETSKNGDTTETHSGTSSESHSGTNTASSSGSVTETKEGTNTVSKEGSTSRSEETSESNIVNEQQTESRSGTGSESHSGSATSTSTTETEGMLEDNKREEELRRSGNIGVTTSQQMIQSEIELRKHNLEDIIFMNMDEVLFLDYYL